MRAVAIYIPVPTSAFTFAPLVARNGGTPCWIPFSSAVPGFALPNRFRGVRDLCFTVVEGPLCARSPIYFLIQRRRSPSAHLVRRRCGTLCSGCYFGCSAVPFSNPGIRFAVGPSRRSYPGIIIIIPNVSVHRTTHLVRRTVERLVQRFHFSGISCL